MKKLVIFILGILVGVAITLIVAGVAVSNNKDGLTFFERPGECLSTQPFEVMQVVGDNFALAHEVEYNSVFGRYMPTDLLVLVTNDDGEYYYDEQIIKIPKGKCMRQVGVYKYRTKMELDKTVPNVKIMDK